MRIWATKVGSFGIQFPITIRPPGFVTRTISLATSNGLGANIAPKMLTTRSKLSSSSSVRSVASPSWKERLVQAEGLGASVSRRDEVAGDVDAEDVGPQLSGGHRGGPVAAAEIEHSQPLGDPQLVRRAPLRSLAWSLRCG